MRKADARISAVSGAGIALVVVGHSQVGIEADAYPSLDTPYQALVLLVRWIYSFHMPLFFSVSGFLLLHASLRGGERPYPPYGAFLQQRASRILLPYLVISTAVFPLKVAMARHALRPVDFTFTAWLENLWIPWKNVIVFFWFLPTLFLMFCAAPAVLSARPETRVRDMLTSLLALAGYLFFPHANLDGPGSFLNVAGALHNFVFFALGFYARKWWPFGVPATPLASLALLAASWAAFLLMPSYPLVSFLRALLGTAALLACLSSWDGLAKSMASIGNYSFQIYLLSWFPQTLVRTLGSRAHGVPPLLIAATSIAAGLLLPIVLTRIAATRLPRRYLSVLGV